MDYGCPGVNGQDWVVFDSMTGGYYNRADRGRWRNGRRSGLKIRRGNTRVGSNPTLPTKLGKIQNFGVAVPVVLFSRRPSPVLWGNRAPRTAEQARQVRMAAVVPAWVYGRQGTVVGNRNYGKSPLPEELAPQGLNLPSPLQEGGT